MIQNLDKLIEKRKSWVQINKENNFHDSIKNLLTELYPDNAHFIYELLQNAEDAQATKVSFNLYKDRLVFEHDGKRLFDLRDIESITSIGSSTKIEKYNNIGKFGVGFKAVFAYTDTPKIYSGEYSFQINEMVVPEIIKNIDKEIDINKTTFVFPFNNPKKSQSKAYQEIENGLRKLDGNCLLFLNNISLISFNISNDIIGNIKRKYVSYKQIEITTNIPEIKNERTNWLRFQDEIKIHDNEYNDKKCNIAIAYKLENSNKQSSNKEEFQIVPLSEGNVFIYFPAIKEYSGLKFHIHAPFASTVARDSIKLCEENNQLRDGISELVVKSCIEIRDMGMLDINFVSVLPNNHDEIQEFYVPIRSFVIQSFKTQNLTPTKNGMHSPANSLYIGPQSISKIIDDDLLSFITNKKIPLWVKHPIKKRSREFFSSLEIKEWGYSNLLSMFEILYENDKKEDFELIISNKDNDWILDLYKNLNISIGIIYKSNDEPYYIIKNRCDKYIEFIKKYKIVKTLFSNEYRFFTPGISYFKNENYKNCSFNNIPFVLKETYYNNEILDENAYHFLEKIGVNKYTEEIDLDLLIINNKEIDKHIEAIKKIINYVKRKNRIYFFKKGTKLLVLNEMNEKILKYDYLENIYLDIPYINSGLTEVKKIHNKELLSPIYNNVLSEDDLTIFIDLLKNNHIFYKLNIIRTSTYKRDTLRHSMPNWFYGTATSYEIDVDYTIEDLDKYISIKSITVSNLIWNELINADSSVATAMYRTNSRYNIKYADSILVYTLKERAWIPDKNGNFLHPQDMTIDKLLDKFKYDDSNRLLTAIGFGEKEKKLKEIENALVKENEEKYKQKEKFIKEYGIDSVEEVDEFLNLYREYKKNGGNIKTLKNFFQLRNYDFPQDDVINKNRREEKIKDNYNNSLEKKYEIRERKIRSSNNIIKIEANERLRNEYTNDDGIMICQICKKEMPFKKRNGEYYFETVEIFKKEVFDKEHPSQYIALCPVCSAKYKEFVKNDEDAIELLKMDILTTDSQEVQIYLGDEETTLCFVEKHLFDLQKILKISNKNE